MILEITYEKLGFDILKHIPSSDNFSALRLP